MAGFTDTEEKVILDHYFGGTTMAAPEASHKIDLLTTLPSDDESTGLVKASYTGYTQATVTNNATNWPAASGNNPNVKSNGAAISFGQKTAAGDTTIVGFAIYDAAGTGLQFVGTTSATVSENDTPEYAIGELDLKLGDPGDTYT